MKTLFFTIALLVNGLCFAQSMGQGGGNGGGGLSVAPKILVNCSFVVTDGWGAILAQKLNHSTVSQMEVNASPTPLENIDLSGYSLSFKIVGDTKLKDKYIISYMFEDGTQRFSSILSTRLAGNGVFDTSALNSFDSGIRLSISCLSK